jgi:uncharacterized SAM-binding protein YcdF (DUF218 family)
VNRAQRRIRKRKDGPERVLDFTKVKSFVLFGLKLIVGLGLFLFLTFVYNVREDNAIRERVGQNPVHVDGYVTEVENRRYHHNVYYIFSFDGKQFSGKCLRGMDTSVGSGISIGYNAKSPNLNLPVSELERETIWDSAVSPTFMITSLALLVFLLMIPGAFVASFLTGNPKYKDEFTSRKVK